MKIDIEQHPTHDIFGDPESHVRLVMPRGKSKRGIEDIGDMRFGVKMSRRLAEAFVAFGGRVWKTDPLITDMPVGMEPLLDDWVEEVVAAMNEVQDDPNQWSEKERVAAKEILEVLGGWEVNRDEDDEDD